MFSAIFCCPKFWIYRHTDFVFSYELRYIVGTMSFKSFKITLPGNVTKLIDQFLFLKTQQSNRVFPTGWGMEGVPPPTENLLIIPPPIKKITRQQNPPLFPLTPYHYLKKNFCVLNELDFAFLLHVRLLLFLLRNI